ncbi:MAG: Cytochrome c4 precursor [Pseudomonadota bacterium]|jgi:cytochrome c553
MNKLLLTIFTALVASAMAFSASAQDIKGDAKAGMQKNAMCIGCHGIAGYQANFPEVYKVPMISGQNAKFIVASLNAYKKGERKHPSMRAIAGSLTDQDMADLAAYYELDGMDRGTSKSASASADKAAELLKKGACASCHGESYNKPIDPSYPKLAGQHADYLYVALKSYKTEGHASWGRSNAIMGGMAKQFSNAELKQIAGYLSAMPGELKTIPESRFR